MVNIVMISLFVFIFLLVFMTYFIPITYKLKELFASFSSLTKFIIKDVMIE
jgi:hypothetical protein